MYGKLFCSPSHGEESFVILCINVRSARHADLHRLSEHGPTRAHQSKNDHFRADGIQLVHRNEPLEAIAEARLVLLRAGGPLA
jgi:hypothetical protein